MLKTPCICGLHAVSGSFIYIIYYADGKTDQHWKLLYTSENSKYTIRINCISKIVEKSWKKSVTFKI